MDFNKRRVAATEPVARLQTFGFFRFNRYKNDTQKQYVRNAYTYRQAWRLLHAITTTTILARAQCEPLDQRRQQHSEQSEWKNYFSFKSDDIRYIYFRRTDFFGIESDVNFDFRWWEEWMRFWFENWNQTERNWRLDRIQGWDFDEKRKFFFLIQLNRVEFWSFP